MGNSSHRNILAFLLLFLWNTPVEGKEHVRGPDLRGTERVIPGLIIVKFKTTSEIQDRFSVEEKALAQLRSVGIKTLQQVFPAWTAPPTSVMQKRGRTFSGLDRIYYAHIDAGENPWRAAIRAAMFSSIEYAEPKYLQVIQDSANDPLYGTDEWASFHSMLIDSAWSVIKTNGNVVVADVDGGTYWPHEDLFDNLWVNPGEDINHNGRYDPGSPPQGDDDGIDNDGDGYIDDVIGWNFSNSTGNPEGLASTPVNGAHGTATASLFGAVTNNSIGMAGSAWNCRLMVLDAGSATTDKAIEYGYEAIAFASAHGVRVINCPWGRYGSYSKFEQDVIQAATDNGSLIVVPAGNFNANNDLTPFYPANYQGVLSVGSANGAGVLVPSPPGGSNFGNSVQVYAAGSGIITALPDGGYGFSSSGTSYSSSIVSGLASLLFAEHPTWSAQQVATQIRVTAIPMAPQDPTQIGELGHGFLNFLDALKESHAGLDISSYKTRISSGKSYVLPGDTVFISVSVKNVLQEPAIGIRFHGVSPNLSLRVLSDPVSLETLDPGDTFTLPDLVLTVDAANSAQTLAVSLRWAYNGTEEDGLTIPLDVFPGPPTWQQENSPSLGDLFCLNAANDQVVWAAGGDGSGTGTTVIMTADGGLHWRDARGDLQGVDPYCIAALDSVHAWVGSSDGRIFATLNGGVNWIAQPYPDAQSPFINGIWFFDEFNGVALGNPPASGTNRFVFLSTTDGGQTWVHAKGEPLAANSETGFNGSFWWTDPQHGWFGSSLNRIWRTADGGSSWAAFTTPVAGCVGVSFTDSLHGIAVHENGLVSVTLDGGKSWTAGGHPSGSLSAVVYPKNGTVAWCSDGTRPYRSADGGLSWRAEITSPYVGILRALTASSSSHAWISTSFGQVLEYRPEAITEIRETQIAARPSFELLQNFPNPFNPRTTIMYSLAHPGRVKVAVYDLLGREVQVLVNEALSAGRHTAVFEAARQPSGIYFFRLQADGTTRVGKMLLVR